jgi:hypothetical protein
VVAEIGGTGCSRRRADGRAPKLTGEPVWKFVMSKRGLNTGVALNGSTVFVSHSEENIDSNEMGMLAALDGTAKGEIPKAKLKWSVTGFQGGFSSPVADGDRLQVDNSANLWAFDVVGASGCGSSSSALAKASAVPGEGKLT